MKRDEQLAMMQKLLDLKEEADQLEEKRSAMWNQSVILNQEIKELEVKLGFREDDLCNH